MKNGETKLSATDELKKHIDLIDSYINETNTKFSNFKEDFLLFADMDIEKLKSMNQAEVFDAAYMLYGYAAYIQDEINKNKIALNWCNDQIEKMVAKNNESFSQYTKYEAKKQIIVTENSYAAKIDQMRLIAESRLQALDGKTYELKRKADILLEKGKRS